MTREQYIRMVRRVSLFGGLGGCITTLTGATGIMAFVVWAGPSLELPAKQFPNENIRGLVGGLASSLVIGPFFLLSTLTPLYWADRLLGLRCPACGKSITFFKPHKVLESGKCRNCQAPLFDPPQPVA